MDIRQLRKLVKGKKLYLFEKEKGGVGSTGSLVTIAHMLIQRDETVIFVEASTTQADITNAYSGHHKVHTIDLTDEDARPQLIDVIAEAPDDAHVLVNIPGGRFHDLYPLHKFIDFVVHQEKAIECQVNIIWTMGVDAASRVTLEALLDTDPPGRVLLNLPAWHGDPERFKIDDQLVARVEESGGAVFATPALDMSLYDMFRQDEIAIDQIAGEPGVTFGTKMVLRQWEKNVAKALEGLF